MMSHSKLWTNVWLKPFSEKKSQFCLMFLMLEWNWKTIVEDQKFLYKAPLLRWLSNWFLSKSKSEEIGKQKSLDSDTQPIHLKREKSWFLNVNYRFYYMYTIIYPKTKDFSLVKTLLYNNNSTFIKLLILVR